jgi:hypothetical protein
MGAATYSAAAAIVFGLTEFVMGWKVHSANPVGSWFIIDGSLFKT